MTAGQLPLFVERERRAPPPPERRLHIAVADLLGHWSQPGWFWTHLPSGEYRPERTGALLKRMGLKAGLPDFLFISPQGVPYFLELKRDRAGRLSPAQKEFFVICERCGVACEMARSFDEAVARLKAWAVLRPGLHLQ